MLRLSNSLVATTIMLRTVGEEVIDKHSADGEDENKETPEELVRDRAVRFKDLNCEKWSVLALGGQQDRRGQRMVGMRKIHTPDNNIKNQNDESNDSTPSTEADIVALGSNRCRSDERGEEEREEGLEEHRELASMEKPR